jgi:hypothetical protein
MLGGALARLEVPDKVERLPKNPEGEPNSKEKLNHEGSLSDLADLAVTDVSLRPGFPSPAVPEFTRRGGHPLGVNCYFGCTSLQTENLEAALARFAAVTTVRKEIAIVEHVELRKAIRQQQLPLSSCRDLGSYVRDLGSCVHDRAAPGPDRPYCSIYIPSRRMHPSYSFTHSTYC